MSFCLQKKESDRFLNALRKGEIDPIKLSEMTSAQRREFFGGIVGQENAKDVNKLFESKLLLKHQSQGFVNWAQNVMGMRPKAKRDLISRIERMDKVLDATNEKAFLNDLAEQKLGISVSYEEAKTISDLSNKVKETREAMEQGGERMEYGHAVVDLNNYVNSLKLATEKMRASDFASRPLTSTFKAGSRIPGLLKSVKSSLDLSAIGIQGFKTMWTHPMIWQRNARRSFSNAARSIGGKAVMDEVNADIVSRPTYDQMRRAKLDVGTTEEAFPETLPEKIPGAGRLFKASNDAFTAFVHKTRADIFDVMMKIADKNGKDLKDPELQKIGRMVNAMVGRGHLGRLEPAADTVNLILFSGRNLMAHVNTLMHPFTGGSTLSEIAKGDTGSNFVRKEAAKNLLKIAAGIAVMMAIAKQFCDDCVELDPRSADFGTFKFGNTRFDMTGGQKSLWVLASRLATGATKSSTTDEVRPLSERDKKGNLKFGTTTSVDLVEDFFENKLSPAGGLIRDFAKGEDFKKNRVSITDPSTYGTVAWNAAAPFPIDTAQDVLTDPNAAPFLTTMILSGLGVNTSTYGSSKSTLVDLKQARDRGDKKEVQRLEGVLKQFQDKERQKAEANKTRPPAREERKRPERESRP